MGDVADYVAELAGQRRLADEYETHPFDFDNFGRNRGDRSGARRELCTIITDASLHPPTGAAGWACYVRFNDLKQYFSGGFPRPLPANTNIAEMLAAGMAMRYATRALREVDPDLVVHMLFQIDNLEAGRLLSLPFEAPGVMPSALTDADYRKAWAFFHEGNEQRHSHSVRHIKAHSGTSTRRTYVHDKVDKLARAAQRKQREKFM